MRRTLLVVVLLVAAVCLPVAAGPPPQQQPPPQQRQPLPYTQDPSIPLELAFRLDDVLWEAEKLRVARQFAAARARLEALERECVELGAQRHRAAAVWAIARIQGQENNSAASIASFERSRDLYRASGLKTGEGAAWRALGVAHYQQGDRAAGVKAVRQAIALYEEINDIVGLSMSYNNLVYMDDGSDKEKDATFEKALHYARKAGDLSTECGVIHGWGDDLFDRSDYVTARPKLLEALACYERTKDGDDIGRVLVSLGRLQRVHGQYRSALEYYQRALAIQQADGTPNLGAVQSLNAIATSYLFLGEEEQALKYLELAVEKARRLKAEREVIFLTGQIGGLYLQMQQYDKAVTLLESALQPGQKAPHLYVRHVNLAHAYSGLGQLARAREYAELAVTESREIGPDYIVSALTTRADISRKEQKYAEAERDLREAVKLVEEIRARTIPVDFMKRGFGDAVQRIYASTIALEMEQQHWRDALETAERARGRAFLDLLASRPSPTTKPATTASAAPTAAPGATASRDNANGSQVAGAPGAVPQEGATATRSSLPDGATGMTTRGRATQGAASAGANEAGVGSSAASASGSTTRGGGAAEAATGAAAGEQMGSRAGAAALSGLPDVGAGARAGVAPQLTLDSSRAAQPADMAAMVATAKRLRSTLLAYWVGEQGSFAWVVSPAGAVHATRIDVPSTRLESLIADASQAVSSAEGGGFALMGRAQTRPWRELYALLIKPVRAHLPTAPNSLLTVVPHGPLFRVSFAALQDEGGRYLVERYRLHYTPAIGVLQFTERHQHTAPK